MGCESHGACFVCLGGGNLLFFHKMHFFLKIFPKTVPDFHVRAYLLEKRV